VRLLTLLPPSHLVQSMGTDAFTIVEVPRFYARRLMAYHPQYLRDSTPQRVGTEAQPIRQAPLEEVRCMRPSEGAYPLAHLEYRGPWGDLRNRADWGKEPDQSLIWLCGPRWLGFIRGCHFAVDSVGTSPSCVPRTWGGAETPKVSGHSTVGPLTKTLPRRHSAQRCPQGIAGPGSLKGEN
jgi:hypothetical protein